MGSAFCGQAWVTERATLWPQMSEVLVLQPLALTSLDKAVLLRGLGLQSSPWSGLEL